MIYTDFIIKNRAGQLIWETLSVPSKSPDKTTQERAVLQAKKKKKKKKS